MIVYMEQNNQEKIHNTTLHIDENGMKTKHKVTTQNMYSFPYIIYKTLHSNYTNTLQTVSICWLLKNKFLKMMKIILTVIAPVTLQPADQ